MGRCLEQQMAGLRQGRTNHESAERVGWGKARRAGYRGAALDARLPGGSEGPLCTVPALFLERLEFLQEQGGCQEPADASVATGFGRKAGGGERRLRLAGVREAHHPE